MFNYLFIMPNILNMPFFDFESKVPRVDFRITSVVILNMSTRFVKIDPKV